MAAGAFPIHSMNRPVGMAPSRARWATVQVDTETGTYVGRLYVPETKKRASDVLSDDRLFIFLTEVSLGESTHVEPFVAINKRFVRTVRILDDGAPEGIPRGLKS
jgi:hypothetical protein